MPATRSRTSTEQAAEVASEEVKQQPTEETEPVVAPPAEDVKEAESVEPVAEAVETPAVTEEAKPVAEEAVVAPENGNGTASAVVESAENGSEDSAEAVAEGDEIAIGEKRKSVEAIGGEDGPDSTEVVAKKAKVDEESVEPAVETPAV